MTGQDASDRALFDVGPLDRASSEHTTRTMVNVRLTLQLKRQWWHLVTCELDCAERNPGLVPPRLKRKFLTQDAAIKYVAGIVERRLTHKMNESIGPHGIVCSVTVSP